MQPIINHLKLEIESSNTVKGHLVDKCILHYRNSAPSIHCIHTTLKTRPVSKTSLFSNIIR